MPASAQQHVPESAMPMWVHLLTNPHSSNQGRSWVARLEGSRLEVWVGYPGSGSTQKSEFELAADRRSLEGLLELRRGEGTRKVRIRPGSDPSRFVMEDASRAASAPGSAGADVDHFHLSHNDHARSLESGTVDAYQDWIGEWSVDGGRLEIRAVGRLLAGTLYASTAGGRSYPAMRIVFRNQGNGVGRLDGVWQRGALDAAPLDGGTLAVEMHANKLGFAGDLYDRGVASAWRGTKLAGTTSGGSGWRPTVVPGQAVPRPGYVSCNSWCRVRIVDSKVRLVPTSTSGKFYPVTMLTVAIHNASGVQQTLRPTSSASNANNVWIAAAAGPYRPDGEGTLITGGFPLMRSTLDDPSPRNYGEPIVLPSGAEVELDYMLSTSPLPRGLDTLTLVQRDGVRAYQDTRLVPLPDPARWLCPAYMREQELEKSGDLAYEAGVLPPLCAQKADAPKDPVAQAPDPVGQTGPATPPASTHAANAGTARPGIFHALEDFDVRLDEARAGRDGKLHVFLTVKNKSARDFYMSSGPFRVVASDADGVGVEAQSRPYRATGEQATAFDEVPTIPAGGEFRMRYVLELPAVHGPLTRVSVRESAKKALYFDVAHADPDPSPMPAPATGRGTFKSLSKLDVRIDNVVPGRDGRLEAFVTLRNPTREVQSTSKGEIKLSGMNADGAKSTSVSVLHSVRGERGRNDELPLLVYVEPGAEMRLRYVFDESINGPITVSDGRASQVFTPGG